MNKYIIAVVLISLSISACSKENKLERDFCSENPGHESCIVSAAIELSSEVK